MHLPRVFIFIDICAIVFVQLNTTKQEIAKTHGGVAMKYKLLCISSGPRFQARNLNIMSASEE